MYHGEPCGNILDDFTFGVFFMKVCCQEGHALVRQRGDEGEPWTCDMVGYSSTGCRYYTNEKIFCLENTVFLYFLEM